MAEGEREGRTRRNRTPVREGITAEDTSGGAWQSLSHEEVTPGLKAFP